MQDLGKQVGSRRYINKERLGLLPAREVALVQAAGSKLPAVAEYNLVRVDPVREEVAFLHYPDLGTTPFPALFDSWRVHLPSSLVTRRKYSGSLNPPILHRTELLLPEDHPRRSAFMSLTQACEAIGLFDNPTIIGFRRNWKDLIAAKGFALDDAELIPLGNAIEESDFEPGDRRLIQRHRTALSRSSLSAPVQCLLRDDLLTMQASFFDYGCGKGDDLAALAANGFSCSGWDPHYRPDGVREAAHVVNLGFVINVIEDYDERVDALVSAYTLAKGVLSVSAMVTTNVVEKFAAYKDGVITRRSTFQKYFSQGELQSFIESALGEDAYAAAPGVFYVFKDRDLEQRYLLRKAGGATRLDRTRLPVPARSKIPARKRLVEVPRATISVEATEFLRQLWRECIARGRVPEPQEIPFAADLTRHFGSFKRATRKCLDENDQTLLHAAGRQRREDILVMLALRMFERRKRFSSLDPALAKDIRAFFGSVRDAETTARELLFSIQDQKLILDACQSSTISGLGHMEEHSLHIHTSLVPCLPAVLRVFVGCASAMAGDLATYDLAKIHIGSGKVTLLQYDDFVGNPLPALVRRVKVRLRDQQIDVFEYGKEFESTLLFNKSRFINEEFPRYAEQVAFEEALSEAALVDSSPHGPPLSAFSRRLHSTRYRIVDFKLVRDNDIPSLDDMCGEHFTYRQLIECGETWKQHRTDNVPKSPETFTALCDLARKVLDPVVEYYGAIKLTYGFSSPALSRRITSRTAPRLDQHASCERNRAGRLICARLGAAIDFFVEYEDMRQVAAWVAANCAFDRLYLYGSDRPIHVSVGPQESRQVFELVSSGKGRVPRRINLQADG